MKILLKYFSIIYLVLILSGCNEDDSQPLNPSIDTGFETTEVASIFKNNCATSGCHTGTTPPNGLSLETHEELFKGSTDRGGQSVPNYGGEVVIPFRSDKSLLYQIIAGNLSNELVIGHNLLSANEQQTLKDWINNGARNNNGEVPFFNVTSRVYVCNQNSDQVAIVDPSNNVVTGILDVNLTPDFADLPHMVKEYGEFYYVTLIGANKFLKVSKSSNKIIAQIDGIDKAGMIQITPDGNKAYVSRSSTSPSIFSSVFVIDINAMNLIAEIDLITIGVPHGMVLSPDGLKLYVLNLTKNTVNVVNTITNESEELIVLPGNYEPMQAAISPDGKFLYISARATGQLLVLDTNTLTIIAEVDLKPMPMQIVVNSSGSEIYINSMMENVVQLVEFDGSNWTNSAEIGHPAFSMLHGIDISSDDKYIYVSGRNTNGNFKPAYQIKDEGPPGIIGIIDADTRKVIKVIETDEFAAGLVVEK